MHNSKTPSSINPAAAVATHAAQDAETSAGRGSYIRQAILPMTAIVSATLVIAACGGGGAGTSGSVASSAASTSSTTSATETPTAIGAITGFGSIVVDGVTYDDSSAAIEVESSPGRKSLAEAKLGHRVLLSLRTDGKLGRVELLPEVQGAVTAVDATAGKLVINGQTIVVNADAAVGPVTAFGNGYTSLADVLVGDNVEVHGTQSTDSSGAAVITATRIEKRVAAESMLRASGYIQNLAASGSSFTLGGLTVSYAGVTPSPTGSTLANGTYVSVMATTPISGSTMTASAIRVLNPKSVISAEVVRVAGVVAGYDAKTSSFTINGLQVKASTASLQPTGASLASGKYARVTGSIDSAGALVATEIQLRDSTKPPVELKGSITSFTSLADFRVRGVQVDASAVTTLTNCPTTGLAVGQFVQVSGSVVSGTVKVQASALSCVSESDIKPGRMIERVGTASAVDTTAKTFTVTTSGGTTVAVAWNDLTYFGSGVTAQTLAGLKVEAEGVLQADGSLLARKIKLHK